MASHTGGVRFSMDRPAPVRAQSVTGTVGQDMLTGQVMSTTHPAYAEYTRRVFSRLTELVDRENLRKSTSPRGFCTVAVSQQTQQELVADYPEFDIRFAALEQPVHSSFVAHRMLANQHAASWVARYADSVVHVGGFRLPYLLSGQQDRVHCDVDHTVPHAVHSAHSDTLQMLRILEKPIEAARVFGSEVSNHTRSRFLQGRVLAVCPKAQKCSQKADAYISDLSQQFVSPLQFMAAMASAQAAVGVALLPYSPTMLVHSEGLLPGTSVAYKLSERYLDLLYPDGVCGETRVSAASWHQWLMACVRRLPGPAGYHYQFELRKVRGPFLEVSVVRLPLKSIPPQRIVHALEMPESAELCLVRTWRLKALGMDPFTRSSWQEVVVTTTKRVVDKTYEHAMAMPSSSFTPYSIRKRLEVTNDRVIVQGTNVEVHAPMDPSDTSDLQLAIFVRAFMDRYDTGKVSSILREDLHKIAGFSSLSAARKTALVLAAVGNAVYDHTAGVVVNWIRNVCDYVRSWLRPRVAVLAQFEAVPAFVMYTRLTAGWLSRAGRHLAEMADCVSISSEVNPFAPGAALLSLLLPKVSSVVETDARGVVVDLEAGEFIHTGHFYDDYVDVRERGPNLDSDLSREVVGLMHQNNEILESDVRRHTMHQVVAVPVDDPEPADVVDFSLDPDPVATLTDLHEKACPGMASQDFHYDPGSISVDDQDRSLAADYLKLPYHFGELPPDKFVYRSNVQAYGVTRRPQVLQETLSALSARNLSAPVVSLPQDKQVLVIDAWENFLDMACLPDARQKLARYQADAVGLEEEAYQDWMKKAKTGNLESILKKLQEEYESVEQMNVEDYVAMLKSDAKPPLSTKPMTHRVEPQVIVYHEKALSSLFSSVFRVLVRRLVSLLKPNISLNLLKDLDKLRDMVTACHPWGKKGLKYLENDFSKYDKSQAAFAYFLEEHIFRQLGMQESLLKKWEIGHEKCNIRCVSLGISLQVRYQRKSGDATTAFGNGLINIVTVMYAYRGTEIEWALFMGDDSLVCASSVARQETAVQTLAEQFNLLAKFYITDAPYFASNFVLVRDEVQRVTFVPDPVKRAERFSMAVTADFPVWEERYESACNALGVYRNRYNLVGLGRAISMRYGGRVGADYQAAGDALATVVSSFDAFRSLWQENPVLIKF